MKGWKYLLWAALLCAACGQPAATSSTTDADSTSATDSAATPTESGTASTAEPKTFAELVAQYGVVEAPYARGRDDLSETWASSPEKRIPIPVMKQFFYGTPGFPANDDAIRYRYYKQLKVSGGNTMLLTYEFAYGDALVASIFDAQGKVLDGLRIFRQGEDPSEDATYFKYEADGKLSLFLEAEADEGFDFDTLRYQITPAGKFQKQ